MKEINDKTLSKIYSGYIGGKIKLSQHRFSEDQEDNILTLDGVCSDGFYVKETGIKYEFCLTDSILVGSISNITNEDKYKLAEYLGYRNTNDFSCSILYNVFKWDDGYSFGCIEINNFNGLSFQYLQSKGYALPYLDYSVEDLVELGVYKLK